MAMSQAVVLGSDDRVARARADDQQVEVPHRARHPTGYVLWNWQRFARMACIVLPVRGQVPVKLGVRFSAKAFGPSLASLERNTACP